MDWIIKKVQILLHITRDKATHFILGFILSSIICSIVYILDHSILICLATGFGISVLISILKDVVWDLIMGKGKFEWMDIVYGIFGAAISIVIAFFVLTFLNGIR